MPQVTLEQARAAKTEALRRFETVPAVVGIGVTRVDGEYAVKINVREPLTSSVSLPREIDGVPLIVETVGPLRKRAPKP